jgi:hypothetical protein
MAAAALCPLSNESANNQLFLPIEMGISPLKELRRSNSK